MPQIIDSACVPPNTTRSPVALIGAASDSYAPHLTAALHSALSRIDPDREVHVLIVDGGMSPWRLARARASLEAAHPRAHVVAQAPAPERLAGLPVSKRYPAAIYLPLVALDLLPAEVDRVLYLDSDVIVTEDVSPLFDMDLGDRALWAARDAPIDEHSERLRSSFPQLREVRSISYANTGVMLINLPVWREQQVSERALDILRNDAELCVWNNQDAINVVLAGEIGLLPDKWNNRLRGWKHVFPELDDAPAQGILHFCGKRKPWLGWCVRDEFYHEALIASGWHAPLERLSYQADGVFRYVRSVYYRAKYEFQFGERIRSTARHLAMSRHTGV